MSTAPIAAPALPPRKRRRVWPFVVVAIVLVVLIVGAFIADAAARSYAQGRIRSQLGAALGLGSSADTAADVRVDLGSGSVLLQALTGKLDAVEVTVPKLAFGDLVGAADIHATRVPLDTAKPVGALSVSYAVTQKNIAVLAKNLTSVPITGVTLGTGQLRATAELTLFAATVPVTLALTPSVSGGRLVFTPDTIGVAGQTFTSSQLEANPIFGRVAKTLLQQQSFCVAQYLPKALVAQSVAVVGTEFVVTFNGDGAALGGSDFRTKGSCS